MKNQIYSSNLCLEGRTLKLTWSFKSFSVCFKNLKFIECTLDWDGKKTYGYAEDYFIEKAKSKAFSEVWERFWMKHEEELIPFKKLSERRNSNGFAAHPDKDQCILNSKLEIIERAEVLSSWQKSGLWKRELQPHLHLINSFLFINLGPDWSFEVYSVSSFPEYETRMALLTHPVQGVFFDSACFMHSESSFFSRIKIDLKLFNSTSRTLPFFPHLMKSLDEMPFEGTPDHHLNFYRNPSHIIAFDVHRKNSGNGQGILKDPNLLKTEVLFEGYPFPAVAFSTHPHWPRLSWGKNSIQSEQKWPHPIA